MKIRLRDAARATHGGCGTIDYTYCVKDLGSTAHCSVRLGSIIEDLSSF